MVAAVFSSDLSVLAKMRERKRKKLRLLGDVPAKFSQTQDTVGRQPHTEESFNTVDGQWLFRALCWPGPQIPLFYQQARGSLALKPLTLIKGPWAPVPLGASGVPGKQAPGGEIVTPAWPWGWTCSGFQARLGERFPHLFPAEPTPRSSLLGCLDSVVHCATNSSCCSVGTFAPCIV